MWKDNKYTIRRNPKQGGLYFASEPSGFQHDIKQKFSRKYIELISTYNQQAGIGFFPLDFENNIFSFAMCKREKATKEDSRPHDIINGFITHSSKEALDICDILAVYIEQKTDPLNFFFSKDTKLINSSKNSYEIFMLEEPKLVQLCKKMVIIKNDNIKLRIYTSDEHKYCYFSLLTRILIQLNLPLFITADMSCSLTAPDIMIVSNQSDLKNLNNFTKGIHYEEISIEEFLDFDNNHIIENAQKAKLKYSNEIDSVLNDCKNYLSNNSVSEYTLYASIDKFYKENNNYYAIFKNRLKDLLYEFDCNASNLNRFITLTYIVFKNDTYTTSMGFSSVMTSAPYDFSEMCSFIKSKATSTRQYYQFLKAMLSIQLKTYFKTPSEKLAFRDALNDVITDFLE